MSPTEAAGLSMHYGFTTSKGTEAAYCLLPTVTSQASTTYLPGPIGAARSFRGTVASQFFSPSTVSSRSAWMKVLSADHWYTLSPDYVLMTSSKVWPELNTSVSGFDWVLRSVTRATNSPPS